MTYDWTLLLRVIGTLLYLVQPVVFAQEPSSQSGSNVTSILNLMVKGADPTGRADSTSALQDAIDEACSRETSNIRGTIYLPAGRYKITRTININCNGISIGGTGKGNTTLLPENEGDLFFVNNLTKQPHIYAANFHDFEIYRVDNPKAGAGIHFRKVAGATVDHVAVSGEFTGIEIESSIGLFFSDVSAGGDNTTPGARLWWIHRASDADENPSENFITNTNSRSLHRNSYTYGFFVQDTDGLSVSNYHIGFTSGPALYIKSQYPEDVIFGLTFSNGAFDEAQYCIYSTSAPNENGGRGAWNFNGMLCELSTLDGLYNDAPHLADVTAVGSQFFLNGRHGINLVAGSTFKLGQSVFKGNNFLNAGGSHAVLAGNVVDVTLDGSSFVRENGPHPVEYNVKLSDSVDEVSVLGARYIGAARGDLDMRTTGTHLALSPLFSDHVETSGRPR
jgi:hypothetical protein